MCCSFFRYHSKNTELSQLNDFNDTIWEEMVFYKSPFTKSVVTVVKQQSKYATVRFRWQQTTIFPSEKTYKNDFWYLHPLSSLHSRCTVETKMVICGINKGNMHKRYKYKEAQVQLHKMRKNRDENLGYKCRKIPSLHNSESKLRPLVLDAV